MHPDIVERLALGQSDKIGGRQKALMNKKKKPGGARREALDGAARRAGVLKKKLAWNWRKQDSERRQDVS